jgi:transposase
MEGNKCSTIVEERMKTVEEIEKIRRAYFLEDKSMRQIAREENVSRNTVRKAIDKVSWGYTLSKPRPARVLGPYKERINELLAENARLPKERINELLAENARLPRKQRYTSHRIYQVIHSAGYTGAESTVRKYVGQQRKDQKVRDVYLPLEYGHRCSGGLG